MKQIKWLFFDMGSTLLDETQSCKVWFQNASKLIGGALSAHEIEQEYRAGMRRGVPSLSSHLKTFGLTGADTAGLYPAEMDIPYPETANVLLHLSQNYKLGIIANQNAGSEERLLRFGLRQYFDVITASAEAGFKKPDPRIFSLALRQADCQPSDAAMIGDRLDNDIFPAKALGLMTVRILQGYGSLQIPKSAAYEPDFTVDSLTQLLSVFSS